ncbi:glycosyltransferase family 2 protein [Vibrio paucivorans]|uniref:Glycosyltransferase n=1 Tax=Vibrio paucivorans TaxID=2829489 RepID=A0A9X3HQQ9_9VIBR|nr:glycosyltransferase family 2 protein [Vibrio paucivorans]MCW8333625.1 glycosyltransferase [Vibrio paucivorans]
MLVSIITPCFNPDEKLIESIVSVQNQSFQDYEHIIVDDFSSKPMSAELLKIIELDPKIRLITRSWNGGAAVSRNRGIQEARGRFIAFLDSDDLWHPKKLELQVAFMEGNNIALCYSSYEVIDSRGKVLGTRTPPSEMTYTDILKSNQIGCLTAIYDSRIIGKVYMPNISKRQDMGLWLKILRMGHVARGIVSQPLGRYRVGHTSLSSNKLNVLGYQWAIYRRVEKLPLLPSIKYFSAYAWKGLRRKV